MSGVAAGSGRHPPPSARCAAAACLCSLPSGGWGCRHPLLLLLGEAAAAPSNWWEKIAQAQHGVWGEAAPPGLSAGLLYSDVFAGCFGPSCSPQEMGWICRVVGLRLIACRTLQPGSEEDGLRCLVSYRDLQFDGVERALPDSVGVLKLLLLRT